LSENGRSFFDITVLITEGINLQKAFNTETQRHGDNKYSEIEQNQMLFFIHQTGLPSFLLKPFDSFVFSVSPCFNCCFWYKRGTAMLILQPATTLKELRNRIDEAIAIVGEDATWNGFDDEAIYIYHPTDSANCLAIVPREKNNDHY
jgi:hypothetical protein